MSETSGDKGLRDQEVSKIVRNHVVWSMGAGLIPVPIADFFAVGAIQLDMIRQMCRMYNVDFKETDGKAIVSALTSSGLARLGARAIKFIPGVGSVIGGVTMSVLSGASTYALGEVFKKHFETGGTILDFDVDRLKKYYNEKFEKGKKYARDIKMEQERKREAAEMVEKQEDKSAVIQRLEELAALKDKGVITEEEFQQLKSKLLSDL